MDFFLFDNIHYQIIFKSKLVHLLKHSLSIPMTIFILKITTALCFCPSHAFFLSHVLMTVPYGYFIRFYFPLHIAVPYGYLQ